MQHSMPVITELFGFININKPKGLTSHDVVARLRRVTNIKQIGHTGTLDPFATGVLPVCIGKAARLIEYLDDDKEYIASVQFGKNTDTYDIDGKVTQTFDKKITQAQLLEILEDFNGEIMQTPPIYSAIKVNGKKLYDYARNGEAVEIKPRKVYISQIELKSFNNENQTAEILIGCSKGTYIRSIAYDLGKKLGCGGYLSVLERTKAGKFVKENSVELKNLTDSNEIKKYLINPVDMLNYPCYELSEQEKKRVMHGAPIIINKKFETLHVVILIYNGKIYAVGKVDKNKILVKKLFEVL